MKINYLKSTYKLSRLIGILSIMGIGTIFLMIIPGSLDSSISAYERIRIYMILSAGDALFGILLFYFSNKLRKSFPSLEEKQINYTNLFHAKIAVNGIIALVILLMTIRLYYRFPDYERLALPFLVCSLLLLFSIKAKKYIKQKIKSHGPKKEEPYEVFDAPKKIGIKSKRFVLPSIILIGLFFVADVMSFLLLKYQPRDVYEATRNINSEDSCEGVECFYPSEDGKKSATILPEDVIGRWEVDNSSDFRNSHFVFELDASGLGGAYEARYWIDLIHYEGTWRLNDDRNMVILETENLDKDEVTFAFPHLYVATDGNSYFLEYMSGGFSVSRVEPTSVCNDSDCYESINPVIPAKIPSAEYIVGRWEMNHWSDFNGYFIFELDQTSMGGVYKAEHGDEPITEEGYWALSEDKSKVILRSKSNNEEPFFRQLYVMADYYDHNFFYLEEWAGLVSFSKGEY